MKKDLTNFELAFVDNTVYTGTDAAGFYSEALLGGKSISYFDVITNVKNSTKLADVSLGDIIQDSDCDFTEAGSGQISQKSFSVEDFKINTEYCKKTFTANYLSELMRPGNANDEIPATFTDYLKELAKKKIQNDMERAVWEGDKTSLVYPLNKIDGLIKQMLADANVIDIAAPVALTILNIVEKLNLVYNAIPEEIIYEPETAIFLGSAAYRLYVQAIASQSNEVYVNQGFGELNIYGTPVLLAPGLGANTIVAGKKNNFKVLTDLLDDMAELELVDMKVVATPKIRMSGGFKFAVSYMYGSELVLYRA